MMRRWVSIVVAGTAAASFGPLAAGGTADAGVAGALGAVAAAGSWQHAVEVPGLAMLNAHGHAEVSAISCPSAGNCAAGGVYRGGSGRFQGFLAVERTGRWGKAIPVPGLAALNAGGHAGVSAVSCGSAGNCTAGGSYQDGLNHSQAFVAVERNGRWGKAMQVPGLAALGLGRFAELASVSCPSAGNCAAAGGYLDRSGDLQAFVVSERNGRWRPALQVPGSGALNTGGVAVVNSVSCASAGNCAAGGFYHDRTGHDQAFVAAERGGRWRRAIKVPGSGALNVGRLARVVSVSCGAAGNCAAGGYYVNGSGNFEGFVASERNGRWGKAIQVPGLAALNTGGDARVSSVSCGSAGNCAAAGSYVDGSPQAFVATERSGRWRQAVKVPGSGVLNVGGDAVATSVSCGSAGNCATGGSYLDGSGHDQAFVAVERNGRWGRAVEVPGTGALNAGGEAVVNSVSCPSAGGCAAGGFYRDSSDHDQGFVVSQA